MNRRKRDANRANAMQLRMIAKKRRNEQHICEHCGKPGGHYILIRPISLAGMISGVDDSEGFWDCPKN